MSTISPITIRLLAALIFVVGLSRVEAEDTPSKSKGSEKHPCDCELWCGLFVANPEELEAEKEKGEEKLEELVSQLEKAFPDHRSFQLIGEKTDSVYKEYESWIVPARQLFLKVDSLGSNPEKKGVHVHLQLWQEDRVLLKSDTILRKQPVFIAGPQWGESGQLIMVLKMMKQTGGEGTE